MHAAPRSTFLPQARTLPYVGGKSASAGAGAWIARILSAYRTERYVEPFCGCLGILLRLPPSPLECVNDADHRIVDFFRCVREKPEALALRLALTPTGSRREFERAKEILRDASARPVERAASVFVILRNALPSSLMERSHFALKLTGRTMWRLPNDVFRLADRLKNVRFTCMDAVDMALRFVGDEKTLIYCDPPYRGRLGFDCKVDHDRLMEVLLAPRGSASVIAISGYEGDYPELESAGWTVYTRRSREWVSLRRGTRIEGLWINRPPLAGTAPTAPDG